VGINIQNSRFANAAGMGSLGGKMATFGRCIDISNSVNYNSVVNIENNYVTVSDVNSPLVDDSLFIYAVNNNNAINVRNNSFKDIRLSHTSGIKQETLITSQPYFMVAPLPYPTTAGIGIGEKKLVAVKVTNSDPLVNQINRINSNISAGETLFIKAEGGPLLFNGMLEVGEFSGKNIFVNGRTLPYSGSPKGFIIQKGQGASFIKIDSVSGYEKCMYQLVSIAN